MTGLGLAEMMDIFDIRTYDFELPPEKVAQFPCHPRDNSRLLLVDRKNDLLQDLVFHDIAGILNCRDVLVINETKVIPARLLGVKEDTGGSIEALLLHAEEGGWACLVKPAKRMRPGAVLDFGNGQLKGRVKKDLSFPGGKLIEFYGYDDWFKTLDEIGQVPLPPYIGRSPREDDVADYQTVYAREYGSAAAPTAGLHFTDELLRAIAENGVEIIKLVLHVGLGTFRPVQVDDIRDHQMHQEVYELGQVQSLTLNRARDEGKRIVAVGTTSVRTLESSWQENKLVPGRKETSLFIYPGYEFHVVDAMVTNFHLPRSSLLMLVYTFGGMALMRKAYRHAVDADYRFFSYGDAMMII